MPGLAPLLPGGHRTDDARTRELTRVCDGLLHRYYVAPAPAVEIVHPPEGATFPAGPLRVEARAGRPVSCWRLFRNAALLHEQPGGDDAGVGFPPIDLAPGAHVLTVHAVTPDGLRAAANVTVRAAAPDGETSNTGGGS